MHVFLGQRHNLKILHVIANLAPRYGGPVKVCLEVCEQLAKRGNQVSIFTTNLDFPAGVIDVSIHKRVQKSGVDIQYFPVQFRPWVYSHGLGKKLRIRLKTFDIVHIHGLYRYPQTIAAHYARKYAVPYIVCPHGSLDPFLYNNSRNPYVKRLYEHLIEFRNLNRASAIHFTAEEERRLTRFLDLKADTVIIPNGIFPDRYRTLPPKGSFRKKYGLYGKRIVLHFGRLNFKKGLDLLVKAFSMITGRCDDCVLVIAGPDNEGYSAVVKQWIREEGIEDQVLFPGMLYGVEVLETLVDADIFALPSYTENFGIAVVEAMACGLPVIISDKVNIWREVAESGAGKVAPCFAERFAEIMLELLDNPEAARQMGEKGKALVKERYQWSKVAAAMEEAYRSIISLTSVSCTAGKS